MALDRILHVPVFEGFSDDPGKKANVLWGAEQTFRLLYLMVENIMVANEEKERARQAAKSR